MGEIAVMRSRRPLLVIVLAFLLSASACSQGAAIVSHGSRSNDAEPTALTIWLWPGSGYEDPIRRYDEMVADVKIEIVRFDFQDLHDNLQTAFAAGYGAPDLVLIEMSYMERFKRFPGYFYNLRELSPPPDEDKFLEWKWRQAASADGTFVFGLPTDIGPMVMAFRVSLYGLAGLPLDREELADLLSDWDAFFERSVELRNKTGKPMIDNIATLYRVILGQAEAQYFDEATGAFIGDRNPAVRKAWDYAVFAKEAGLSAGLSQPTSEWARGMEQGHFATLLAPSWMLSYVTENSPGAVRQWNITQLPGGSGNWGGSFLTIPKESAHPAEAYRLIRWLTDEPQQLELFKTSNIFPALPALYDNPVIRDKRDGFFMGAPVGELLSEAAKTVRPVYEGPYQYIVHDIMDAALMNVENGLLSGDRAWEDAMTQIRKTLAEKQHPRWRGGD